MLLLVFILMGCAMFAGLPPVPVLVIGAIGQCALAYVLTRRDTYKVSGLGMLLMGFTTLIFMPMFVGSAQLDGSSLVQVALIQVALKYGQVLLGAAAVLALLSATLGGLLWPQTSRVQLEPEHPQDRAGSAGKD